MKHAQIWCGGRSWRTIALLSCVGVMTAGCGSSGSGEPCGNGLIDVPETCDDGNVADGDGCSSMCTVEPDFECSGEPSVCVALAPHMQVSLGGDRNSGDTFAFPSAVDVGMSSTPVSISIINNGNGDLTITSVTTSGNENDFVLSTPSMVVAPGSSTSISATFSPMQGGMLTMPMTINSDDPSDPAFVLNLEGHTTPNVYRTLTPASSPSARYNHSMVDLGDGQVMMFGGRDAGGTFLNDTWFYDIETNTWTELMPATQPPARQAFGLAVGQAGQVILFGGSTGMGGGAASDTWSFAVGAEEWTQLTPIGGPPAARFQHNMVSLGDGTILLYGGRNSPGIEVGDTWLYDANADTWSDLMPATAPGNRSSFAMGFDGSQVLVYGGFVNFNPLNDTWSFDVTAGDWSALIPATTNPGARAVHSGAFFEGGTFILHSGKLNSCCIDPTAGTFEWDPVASDWSEITPASEPPARFNYGFAYIEGANKAIVFGGNLQNAGSGASIVDSLYEYVGPLP